MLDRATVSILWCPSCREGGLGPEGSEEGDRLNDGALVCESCRTRYPIEGGIPHLKAVDRRDEAAWRTWKDHIEGFAARRAIRESAPSTGREERWKHKMQAFADFLEIPDGRLLDVGCGPGNLRKLLDPGRVRYHGLDPLPVAGVEDFPFVCALAESIPFRSGAFSGVVVRSALDHFCDLEGFFREAARVLEEGGRLFLEQVIHGGDGIGGLARNAVHWTKDVVDAVRTREERKSAPKHMREFSRDALFEAVKTSFEVERSRTYNSNWYTPTQMFLSLKPRARAEVAAGAR
jgi:ubiquinone/menaquinone biosynthesis C-methylase UbiE